MERNQIASGIISIDNIQIPIKKDRLNNPNSKFIEWFVGIISCETSIYVTDTVTPTNGYISFNKKILFDKLDWDFTIKIDVYCLKLQKVFKKQCGLFKVRKYHRSYLNFY